MFDDIVILVCELDEEHTEEKEVFATVESVGISFVKISRQGSPSSVSSRHNVRERSLSTPNAVSIAP